MNQASYTGRVRAKAVVTHTHTHTHTDTHTHRNSMPEDGPEVWVSTASGSKFKW